MTFQLAWWIFFSAVSAVGDRQWVSARGRRKLLEIDPTRAASVRSLYRSRALTRLFLVAVGLYLVFAASSIVERRWWDLGLCVVGALVAAFAYRTRRRCAPVVLGVLAEREIPPAAQERSRRRTRRLAQWGSAALVLFLGSGALVAVASATDATAVKALAGAAMVGAVVAFFAMIWAGAWRYGDEELVRD